MTGPTIPAPTATQKSILDVLGTGWKTAIGALLWAIAHAGVLSFACHFVPQCNGDVLTSVIANIGVALVGLGLAHKLDNGTLVPGKS